MHHSGRNCEGTALPPGPKMPRAAQAAAWALRPLAFMDWCHDRYGEIFTLNIRSGRPWVLLTNPDHVKQVFTTDPRLLRVGAAEANPLLGPLLGPRSLTLLDEPEHMDDRRRILPSFHGECLQAYDEMMIEVTRRQIARWPQGEPFALWPRMQAISREVLMRGVFGGVESNRLELLRERLVELTAWVNNPRRLARLAAFGPRSVAASKRFHEMRGRIGELVLAEVRERRAHLETGTRRDILSMLEQAYAGDGAPMSEEKLRDEIVTLLSDGPTATSLAWAFARLLRRPDKLSRLREETVGARSDEYAEAIVKETLRLCPAVPVAMRRTVESMQLGDYRIPADSMVTPCIYLLHLRADIYPDPRAFRPERFLENATGTYTWIPFGGGARRCIAAGFSMLEMKRVMQVMVRDVELTAVDRGSLGAARSSVSFAPDSGALVVATRRAASGPAFS